MPENLFGEAVAASYDDDSADLFEPSVVDPVVEFLAGLAGCRFAMCGRRSWTRWPGWPG
jgi:hypothetical protein